jgi:membrane protein implicated in regulation of membrane protease activity
MTAAEAAKLVSRDVGKDGKPNGEIARKPVRADEVLDFRDYGDHVVVVTVDGQKLTGEKAAK